ncbi:hypothetical protein C725_1982 [Pacificimonas flava]|uniref:Uncharacterized protein n=1 Tax=Pacificimonas flava TaxID=1234595 RepID=M2SB30_9SPHN|nr:hypothetical protein C725_1982 [Pacificimonas flava]
MKPPRSPHSDFQSRLRISYELSDGMELADGVTTFSMQITPIGGFPELGPDR